MSDDTLRDLATDAGISVEWTDTDGRHRVVSVETLRAMLTAMGIGCATDQAIGDSRSRLRGEHATTFSRPMITANLGEPIHVPFQVTDGARALIEFEQGGSADVLVGRDGANASHLEPILRTGYHRLYIGDRAVTLAVAPPRCWTVADATAGHKTWGLTAQVHALRRARDGGIGDFGAVAELARDAAKAGADALSLSPTHALFAADDNHFTPYSPSSRLFHNILLADPRATFDVGRVEQAQAHGADAAELARFEANELIDWPRAGRARKAMLRALFDSFRDCELLTPSHPLAADFSRFCAAGGDALEKHATFEAIHAKQFSRDFTKWHWRDWPAELRDCNSPIVRGFAASNPNEIGFHKFAQWLVDRSIRKAQGMALGAGMRIGLVSDLAVGMNDGGSHAWSAPNDLLLGLSIGAPPDPLAPRGQNWGLTNFSPHALVEAGFAPFLATLRAALRHAGGARIDHVMGVSRLWLTPRWTCCACSGSSPDATRRSSLAKTSARCPTACASSCRPRGCSGFASCNSSVERQGLIRRDGTPPARRRCRRRTTPRPWRDGGPARTWKPGPVSISCLLGKVSKRLVVNAPKNEPLCGTPFVSPTSRRERPNRLSSTRRRS
jgi:4-alpha-glucanotransferase